MEILQRSTSASWKKLLQKFAIKPVQQFAYTIGKNSTDSALIIDAMDLMYTKKFDGFCLVTSDSDFTGLAVRIREEGLSVFAFGETKTPAPLTFSSRDRCLNPSNSTGLIIMANPPC